MLEELSLRTSRSGRRGNQVSGVPATVRTVQLGQDFQLEDRVAPSTGLSLGQVPGILLNSPAIVFWYTAARGGELLGYPFAGFALRHSLLLAPGTVNLNTGGQDLDRPAAGFLLNKVQNSNDLRAFVANAVAPIAARARAGVFQGSVRDTLEFKRTTDLDLYLALHKMDNVFFQGFKYADGRWTLAVTIRKNYDFQYNDYKSVFSALNNAALASQYLGAIHNYDIQATLYFTGKGGALR